LSQVRALEGGQDRESGRSEDRADEGSRDFSSGDEKNTCDDKIKKPLQYVEEVLNIDEKIN
jgi:hypothetical protein